MRFNALALTALLPAAGLLTGCAMGTQGANTIAAANPAVKAIKGRAFGGQQAVANGQIVVYEFGNTGYGSAGTAIASTNTDSGGNFVVNYTCSDPNAPVYILSIGGQPGLNLPNNGAIVLGSGIGTCAASETGYVTINEISTTALAFSLSHFFSANTSDSYISDHFGSPASLTSAIGLVNSGLLPTLLDVTNGYPRPSTATFTTEGAKIITIADIIGACVNSIGSGSPACNQLFGDTTGPSGAVPVNTLEAAVYMSLNPTANVADLYSLVPPSGSSAFAGSLPSQPHDWSIAVNYVAPSLGLGVDPYTITTLDIDNSGRVWFPTNVPGTAGVANFDPSSSTFSAAFTAPGLVHPEQVAIDINSKVWVSDTESGFIAGFPAINPGSPTILSQPGSLITTALTVLDDDSLRFALYDTGANVPSFAEVSADNTTYTAIPNTTPTGAQGYAGASLAGDLVGGAGASATDSFTPNLFDLYISPSSSEQFVAFQDFADAGQVVFTGNDFVSPRGGFNGPADGLCIYSTQNCSNMVDQSTNHHPTGIVVDGGGSLWMSDLYTADVQQVVRSGGSYTNSNGLVPNTVLSHDVNNGSTLVGPGGIAVDNTGNVWVSNQGCTTRACTPGAFVLTEIIGAGYPTLTPISAQVVLNTAPGIEPQNTKPTSKAK